MRFHLQGQSYQFKALPFGLSTVPMEFTVVVKEVKLIALQKGIRIQQYLDDWLVRAAQQIHHVYMYIVYIFCIQSKKSSKKNSYLSSPTSEQVCWGGGGGSIGTLLATRSPVTDLWDLLESWLGSFFYLNF